MMAVIFFIVHEKGFKFHGQPETGTYSYMGLDSPILDKPMWQD